MRNRRRINRIRTQAEVLALFLIDLLSLAIIFRISVYVRKEVLPLVYPAFPAELPFVMITDLWWVFLIWIFFLLYEGLYTKRFSFWDEIKSLWKVSFLSTAGIFIVVSIGKLSADISRTVIVLMGVISVLFFPAVRIMLKKVLRKLGFLQRRVLVLGAGKTGRLIVAALRREPNYGYKVVGFVDDDPGKVGENIEGIKVHRGIDRAQSYIRRCNIEDLFIAMPGAGKERVQGLINNLQHKVERILFVPDIYGIAVLGTGLRHFFHEEVLAFEIENNLSNPLNMIIKRSFDFLVSALLIPLLAVPMAVIAVLIRMDSHGPAFFSQPRIGERGRIFRCLKFRTMHDDAEERLHEIIDNDPESKREWEERWKLKNDPRITRIGRFLRRTSLDELPQIVNVLKGEMSFVGPRPYLVRERKEMGDAERTILMTRPGITGLWQVSGRSTMSYDYRISLDSWYVRNWNLWLDIVILFKTVRIVLKREGAY